MELSYQELVRLTMVYMLSSDPLIYTNALNLIRENVGTNEGIINQEWYKEADRLTDHIENSLLWKALNEKD